MNTLPRAAVSPGHVMRTSTALSGILVAFLACSGKSGGGTKATGGTTVVAGVGGVAQSGTGGSSTGGRGWDAAPGTGGIANGGAGGGAGSRTSDGGGDASPGGGGAKTDAALDVPYAGGGTTDAGEDAAAGGMGTGGRVGAGSGGTGDTTGLAGTGGSGGAGGTSAPAGTGGTQVTCTAVMGAAVAPVVVTASLSCTNHADQINVAPGAGTSGFVALTAPLNGAPSFFFDISASIAKVEQILPDVIENHMVTNATGALAVVQTLRGSGTAFWLSRDPAGSSPAWVSSPITDTMLPSGTIACAIAPDATQYAAFLLAPDANLAVAKRQVGGSTFATTTVSPASSASESVLAVDAAGALHVLYWISAQGLVDSQPGQALVTALASTTGAMPRSMQGVRPSGLGVALAVLLDDGIHVIRRGASAAFDDIPISGTKPSYFSVPIGPIPCTMPPGCSSQNQSGDGVRAQALAQAADGTLWLVTVRDHVDRTVQLQITTNEACQCAVELDNADDRSSSVLVVQKIAPGATTPSAILWSLDLALPPWTSLSVSNTMLSASAGGAYLFLAIRGSDGKVQYLVLDTTGLH
jgi:hypothetical protein